MISNDAEHPAEISAALTTESVAVLLKTISASSSVSYAPSDDSMWGSETSFGRTTIHYAKGKHPASALAHELLHAELKIAGYRQYTFAVAKKPCPHRTVIPNLLGILDNELQHHRMAKRFSMLGLELKHFYHDGDAHAYKKVRRELEKMSSADSTKAFFSQFVTVIAPGGAGTELERSQLKTFLLSRCSPQTARNLKEIEAIFSRWKESPEFDAGLFIKEILLLLDVGCTFWFGASHSFPTDGFFISDEFEIEDSER